MQKCTVQYLGMRKRKTAAACRKRRRSKHIRLCHRWRSSLRKLQRCHHSRPFVQKQGSRSHLGRPGQASSFLRTGVGRVGRVPGPCFEGRPDCDSALTHLLTSINSCRGRRSFPPPPAAPHMAATLSATGQLLPSSIKARPRLRHARHVSARQPCPGTQRLESQPVRLFSPPPPRCLSVLGLPQKAILGTPLHYGAFQQGGFEHPTACSGS